MLDLEFNISEILSLFGVVQSVYILVYLCLRSQSWRSALLPFLYFIVLGSAFFMDFASRFIAEISVYYPVFQMGLWFSIPSLGVLVVIHIAQVTQNPLRKYGWVLLMPFVAFVVSFMVARHTEGCDILCSTFFDWFVLSNLVAGGLSLLGLWGTKSILLNVRRQKFGQERYWLILSFIISNISLLLLMFGYFGELLPQEDVARIRTLLGLALVYLITTSLFRIYPQTAWISGSVEAGGAVMSEQETQIALRIKNLFELEKVYHEPGYNRRDLALEIGEPEGIISRIINLYFGKSLPQLLNEYRVEDAKRLLLQTIEPISVIASESGFSSIATFNRVFRESEGISPSEFRKNIVKD